MPANADPTAARVHNHSVIHIQGDNGGAAYSGQANKQSPGRIPLKMLGPNLLARMEKRNRLAGQWILRRCSAALELITTTASKTEVLKRGISAQRAGKNVVNGHRLASVCFSGLSIDAMAVVGCRQTAVYIIRQMRHR